MGRVKSLGWLVVEIRSNTEPHTQFDFCLPNSRCFGGVQIHPGELLLLCCLNFTTPPPLHHTLTHLSAPIGPPSLWGCLGGH
jgi:hypothetical protein